MSPGNQGVLQLLKEVTSLIKFDICGDKNRDMNLHKLRIKYCSTFCELTFRSFREYTYHDYDLIDIIVWKGAEENAYYHGGRTTN